MTSTTSDPSNPNIESKQDTIAVDDKVKACVDCVHLIGVRHRTDEAEERWHCGNTQNVKGWATNPVTGIAKKVFKEPIIMDVRIYTCKGDWWEKYVQPVREPTIGGSVAVEFDATTLAAQREAASKRVEEIRTKRNAKLTGKDFDNL